MKPFFDNPTVHRAITLLALLVCAYYLGFFLLQVFINYWPGPIHDYWFEIPKIEDYYQHALSWHELITAHANAHRLVIPRLVFILDYVWFHGTNTFIVFVAIACKFTVWLVLNHVIRNESTGLRALLNALICATLFSTVSIPSIQNSSNVQWDLMAAFCVLAVWCYTTALTRESSARWLQLLAAYLLFVCGFLSQGGALPAIFVFLVIAVQQRQWKVLAATLVLTALVLYLTAAVLPVNDDDSPGFASAVMMFLLKPKYVALFALKLMSANVFNLGDNQFWFSAWYLLLLAAGLVFHQRTRHYANNTLLYIACFSVIMMIFIAAFRCDFAPNAWASNRYHPNTLLFVLCLHLNAFLLAATFVSNQQLMIIRSLLLIACGYSLLTPQWYQYKTPAEFSNVIYETQVSGLYYGPNQDSARRLVTSVHPEFDKIANADPFFREHGFAYYANKQGNIDPFRQARRVGEVLLQADALDHFTANCVHNRSAVNYTPRDDGTQNFTSTLHIGLAARLHTLFGRDTYYVLDEHGVVTGFAYVRVDSSDLFGHQEVVGITRDQQARYIAEIKHDEAVCRFALAP